MTMTVVQPMEVEVEVPILPEVRTERQVQQTAAEIQQSARGLCYI